MIVYYNGQLIEKAQVAISPDDRGFLFADGVYEVIRSYAGRLFRSAEHLERLACGLNQLRIAGIIPDSLTPVFAQLLHANQLHQSDATLYIQITRGVAPRSHRFPPADTPPTCYIETKPALPHFDLHRTGAPAITVPDQRWARCDIKTVGLLPNTLAFQRAHEAGAFEAIFSRDGLLQEGSHSSILFVRDGALLLPPLTNFILPSITRHVVHALAAVESIPTSTQPCFENQLPSFDEILMLSTTAEIVPIIAVNGEKVGRGEPGIVARRLQAAFQKLTRS